MNDQYNQPAPGPDNSRALLLATLLFLTGILVVLDLIYGADVMALSVDFSVRLQKLNLETFSLIFSYLVMGLGLAVFLLHFFFVEDKRLVFPMVFGFMVCVWFHGFAKLLWMDYRPSFLSRELRSGGAYCVAEFGKPSGHALFSFYIFLCLGKFLEQRYFRGDALRIGLSFLANLLIAATIGVTRFYFGVHSVNQVVLGAYFGWLIFFCVLFFARELKLYLYDPVFEKTNRPDMRSSLVAFAALFAVLYVALLLVFLKARLTLEGDTTFIRNIVNCVEVTVNFIDQFTLMMELNSLYFALLNFWLIGLLFSRLDVAHGLQFAYDGSWLWFGLRTLVYCLPIGVVMVLLRFVVVGSPALEITIETVLLVATGFLVGMFGLSLLEVLGIPIKKPQPGAEAKPLQTVVEMTDISI